MGGSDPDDDPEWKPGEPLFPPKNDPVWIGLLGAAILFAFLICFRP